MKTLTVTIHHSTNYGASLQAYALQQALEKLGIDNLIFEYPYKNNNSPKAGSRTIKSILRTVYLKYLKILRSGRTEELAVSFAEFHKSKMKLTRIYESMEDLRNDPPLVDAYITGSDQVWNLATKNEFIPARFLDFGPEEIKRISYAASIEVLNYSNEDKTMVRRCLSKFNGVSLREQSACEYIESITDRKPYHVVDPVLLLTKDDWRNMSKKPRVDGPYILTYQVLRNNRMQEVVDRLKQKTGYPVVQVCNTQVKWIKADKTFYDVSPEEFIGLYENAAVVVSASFHGTALGLVFGKPTYGLVRNEYGSRIKEILEMFGLDDYCIGPDSNIPEPYIDQSKLDERIERERINSIDFLSRYLS